MLYERPYGVASFFAGIGGLDLGLQQAGLTIRYQCENDSFCNAVLRSHWPSVNRAGDIREVHIADIPQGQEVWCAGFPCQDVSLARARNRRGLAGEQSGLFFEFVRLLAAGHPRVVVLENVPGILSSNGGRDFTTILDSLGKCGYSVAWRVLNSRFFGVPQSRRRIYIIGYRGTPTQVAEILFERECSKRYSPAIQRPRQKAVSPFMESVGENGNEGPIVPRLAYCLSATTGRHTGTDWSRTYVAYADAVRRITPTEAERLQGFPDGWTIPRGSEAADDDAMDSRRYTALGNAVTVDVSRWLGNRIIRVLDSDAMSPAHQVPVSCCSLHVGHSEIP